MTKKGSIAAASVYLLCACGSDANDGEMRLDSSSEATSDSSSSSQNASSMSASSTSGTANTVPSSTANSTTPNATSAATEATTSTAATTSTNMGSSLETQPIAQTSTASDSTDDTRTTAPATQSNSETVATSSDESDTGSTTSNASTSSHSSSDVASSGECEFSGSVSYRINDPASFPADALEKLTAALDEAIYYYNCYSDLSHSLTINYKPSVPTAEGNVDGVISFGSDRNYMVVATVMHEIGHTMGVGYAPWSELIQDGKWVGPAVVEYISNLPADERDPDMYSQRTYITCDSQHFWPYGLNQASEHQSEWSLIDHVRIVAAMNKDKDAFR